MIEIPYGIVTIPVDNSQQRKIIHIDMDAFYASVEMRDNPALRDKPVIMARHPRETHGKGVVSTCNYVARAFGVRSGMSSMAAYERCPEGVFLPVNMSYYIAVSQQIHRIFKRYTNLIEPLSIDEAFLDVTDNLIGETSAIRIAQLIQRDIFNELQLTCSAGVSYNKFLAKVASDFQKPSGLTVILPEEAYDFLTALPIEKFFGIGQQTVQVLHGMGIYTGGDIQAADPLTLVNKLGKIGMSLVYKARGIDLRPVNPHHKRQSIGKERTFHPPIQDDNAVQQVFRQLSQRIADSLSKRQLHGEVITIKLRNTSFETITRQQKLERFIHRSEDIFSHAFLLMEEHLSTQQAWRLLGITVGGLAPISYEPIRLTI